MARKKTYKATATIGPVASIDPKKSVSYASLAAAQESKSQNLVRALESMKPFIMEKHTEEAGKRAAKRAIDNDPLINIQETEDSVSIEDRLVNAEAYTRLGNNLMEKLMLQITQQGVNSLKSNHTTATYIEERTKIINKEFRELREKFDSPRFEVGFKEKIANALLRDTQSYQRSFIELKEKDLHAQKLREKENNIYLDVQAQDLTLTQTRAFLAANPVWWSTEEAIKSALDDARTQIYTSQHNLMVANKDITADEKKEWKEYWTEALGIAKTEKNYKHEAQIQQILEKLNSSGGSASFKEQVGRWTTNTGSSDAPLAGIVSQTLNHSFRLHAYKNMSPEEQKEHYPKGVPKTQKELIESFIPENTNPEDRAKLTKDIATFTEDIKERPLYYRAQLDNVDTTIGPDGMYADGSTVTYITNQYPLTQQYVTGETAINLANRMNNEPSVIKRYELMKKFVDQYVEVPNLVHGQLTANIVDNLPAGTDGQIKMMLDINSYMTLLPDDAVQIILKGEQEIAELDTDKWKSIVQHHQPDLDAEKAKLKQKLRAEDTVVLDRLMMRYLAGKVMTDDSPFHRGWAEEDIEFPSEWITEAYEAARGIVKDANGEEIAGYGHTNNYRDNNFWLDQEHGDGITREYMDRVLTEKNLKNITPYLYRFVRDNKGQLVREKVNMPPGWARYRLAPEFITPSIGQQLDLGLSEFEVVLRDPENIDFSDDEINDFQIVNSEENDQYAYLSNIPNAGSREEMPILMDTEGHKIQFAFYEYAKDYREYEHWAASLKQTLTELHGLGTMVREQTLALDIPTFDEYVSEIKTGALGDYDEKRGKELDKEFPLTMEKPNNPPSAKELALSRKNNEQIVRKNEGAFSAWVWHADDNEWVRHGSSVDPSTGRILKKPWHKTFMEEVKASKKLGNVFIRQPEGWYSVNPERVGEFK